MTREMVEWTILGIWGLALIVATPYVWNAVLPTRGKRVKSRRNPMCSYKGCESYWLFIVSVNGKYRRACFEHALYAFALHAGKMIHYKP